MSTSKALTALGRRLQRATVTGLISIPSEVMTLRLIEGWGADFH